MDRVRIGTLGAARITANALIQPAREVPEAVLTAVASRDPARARAFADMNGIGGTRDSYQALIEDPDIDAIYNPLPNSLHAPWTLTAIEAGKHVLCEKPFASNQAQAQTVAAAAQGSGLVVMEAFHYRYHPLARRMHEIVHGPTGELGAVRHIEVTLCFPIDDASDIRFRYELGVGAGVVAWGGRGDDRGLPLSCQRGHRGVSCLAAARGPFHRRREGAGRGRRVERGELYGAAARAPA